MPGPLQGLKVLDYTTLCSTFDIYVFAGKDRKDES